MKKLLLSTSVLLSLTCFQSQVFGQERPEPPNERKVVIVLAGSPDDLDIQVVGWRRNISVGENVRWTLVDARNLTRGFEVNDEGKKCEFPFPPEITAESRNLYEVVHGPFSQQTTTWCHYNIVLHTAGGDMKIDPDYKVGP